MGRNPRNGGSPPKDRRFIIMENFSVFDVNMVENNWLIWINFIELSNITTLNVNRVYNIKYVNHKGSLDLILASIQPRWLMDENAIIFRKEV